MTNTEIKELRQWAEDNKTDGYAKWQIIEIYLNETRDCGAAYNDMEAVGATAGTHYDEICATIKAVRGILTEIFGMRESELQELLYGI